MLDEEDYRHVAPAMPVTDLPTSAKTITVYRRRDIGSVLKGIKTYAAAARSAKDRRRLAREVRAVADQIDGSHDARWLHDAFDLELALRQLVLEVVEVTAVEEALLLKEIDEHQSVEQD